MKYALLAAALYLMYVAIIARTRPAKARSPSKIGMLVTFGAGALIAYAVLKFAFYAVG